MRAVFKCWRTVTHCKLPGSVSSCHCTHTQDHTTKQRGHLEAQAVHAKAAASLQVANHDTLDAMLCLAIPEG